MPGFLCDNCGSLRLAVPLEIMTSHTWISLWRVLPTLSWLSLERLSSLIPVSPLGNHASPTFLMGNHGLSHLSLLWEIIASHTWLTLGDLDLPLCRLRSLPPVYSFGNHACPIWWSDGKTWLLTPSSP